MPEPGLGSSSLATQEAETQDLTTLPTPGVSNQSQGSGASPSPAAPALAHALGAGHAAGRPRGWRKEQLPWKPTPAALLGRLQPKQARPRVDSRLFPSFYVTNVEAPGQALRIQLATILPTGVCGVPERNPRQAGGSPALGTAIHSTAPLGQEG